MEQIIAQIITDMVNNIFAKIRETGIGQLAVIGESLKEYTNECVLKMLRVILEEIDSLLLDNKRLRKTDGLTIQQRDVPRVLTTAFGELEYKRTYYRYLEEGKARYAYLTDLVTGVEPYERVTADFVAQILSDVELLSYRNSAKNHSGSITGQTVHNRLMATREMAKEPEHVVDLKTDTVDIFADEDHVHMQPKKQSVVPLVVITDGIKDGVTLNPFYLQGCGMNTDSLCENVLAVLTERYGADAPLQVRLHCDGGSWIKKLTDTLPNVTVYMDGFHIEKYLKKLLHFKEGFRYGQRIRNALRKGDWDSFFVLGTELASLQNENGQKSVHEILGYFNNNRESISNRMKARENGVCGSCTEGLVSHILSERLSRDPISWSEAGLQKMASLLIFKKNGGKILPKHIRCSVSRKEKTKEKNRFRECGFELYRSYAEQQSEAFLQKKLDWSILEPATPTFGKIDGTRVLLSALGELRDTLASA